MNHEARLTWAEYLGGRIPKTQQEEMDIWNALPGNNVLAKATHAGIPFSGCFSADDRKFYYVGDWAYLISSAPYLSGHESLDLGRLYRDAGGRWRSPQLGYSALVVQDKA